MQRLYVVALMSKKQSRTNKLYLVGTIDRWNSAKQAEEHDRVKHAMSSLAHEHTIGQI